MSQTFIEPNQSNTNSSEISDYQPHSHIGEVLMPKEVI